MHSPHQFPGSYSLLNWRYYPCFFSASFWSFPLFQTVKEMSLFSLCGVIQLSNWLILCINTLCSCKWEQHWEGSLLQSHTFYQPTQFLNWQKCRQRCGKILTLFASFRREFFGSADVFPIALGIKTVLCNWFVQNYNSQSLGNKIKWHLRHHLHWKNDNDTNDSKL